MEKAEKREVCGVCSIQYAYHMYLCLCSKWLDKCIQPQVKSDDRLVDSLIIVPGIKVHLDSTVIITSSLRMHRPHFALWSYSAAVLFY